MSSEHPDSPPRQRDSGARHRSGKNPGMRHGRRRSRRIWVPIVVSVGALLLAAMAWMGVRGYLAYTELSQLQPLAATLKDGLTAGNVQDSGPQVDALVRHAVSAQELTGDPLWGAAELIPYLGPNLAAVRTISAAAADLATQVVEPLMTVSQTTKLADLKPVNGHINTDALAAAQPQLAAAATVAAQVDGAVAAIDESQLLGPLATQVQSASDLLHTVSSGVTALSNAATLVPNMLGASGERNYVVIVQNNAELRATGGVPGALAMLHTDHGVVTLTRQSSTTAIQEFAKPVISLPQGTINVFGPNPAKVLQDTTMTPDFSVTAQSVSAMWQKTYGLVPDGVLSLDPVTLSYLLAATGPVTLPTGEKLSAGDAAELLLHDVYINYPDPRTQDSFFAGTAEAVFAKIAKGGSNSNALLSALTRAGSENRVFIWSAQQTEQSLLAGSTLEGILPQPRIGAFGVYLNDETAAKMDYYLTTQIQSGAVGCRADGKQTSVVSVTLTNGAPADAATSLPGYVTGAGIHGTPPGNIRTSIVVYGASAEQGVWGEVLENGQHRDSFVTTDGEHSVIQSTVELTPGQSRTITFRMLSNAVGSHSLSLLTTPLLTKVTPTTLAESCSLALK